MNSPEKDLMALSLEAWNKKASLRYVYNKLFEEIESLLLPGKALEIGCGTGRLRDYLSSRCIGIDIHAKSRADVICNGMQLSFRPKTFQNAISINVLHHVQYPIKFLKEVRRVLSNNGRYIIIEPSMGFLNHLIFRLFHHELCVKALTPHRDAIENFYHNNGNYYYAHWFFYTHNLIKKYVPFFHLEGILLYGSVVDFLCGGYTHKNIAPDWLCERLSRLRYAFPQSRIDAYRMIVVLDPYPDGKDA